MKNSGFVNVQCVSKVPAPDGPDVVSDSVLNSCFDAELNNSFDYPGNDSVNSNGAREGDPFYGVVGEKPLTAQQPSSNIADDPLTAECSPEHLGALKALKGRFSLHLPYYQLQRASQAYLGLCQWAISIGIPESAIQELDGNETIESLKEKREYMQGMIASFVSSGL